MVNTGSLFTHVKGSNHNFTLESARHGQQTPGHAAGPIDWSAGANAENGSNHSQVRFGD